MEYITSNTYEASRVRSKSNFVEIEEEVEDNSSQVIQRVKEQLAILNRLKQK